MIFGALFNVRELLSASSSALHPDDCGWVECQNTLTEQEGAEVMILLCSFLRISIYCIFYCLLKGKGKKNDHS